jgi:calcipressin-2
MPGRTLPIKTTFAQIQPRQSPSPPITTNTLVLAGIPQNFFHPMILDILRSHFEVYGQVHTFAPLKAFGRVLIVYFDEDSAERGKQHLDWIQLSEDE